MARHRQRRRGVVGVGAAALLAGIALVGPAAGTAHAAGGLVITEVAPWGSGNSAYAADWFELTNNSASAIDLTGWKIDDNSNNPTAAVPMAGVTTLAPGASAIFLESASPATTVPAFLSAWFGATPPATLSVGTYSGAGVGLSTGGDAVNVYDAGGVLRANVVFGASPAAAPFASFDNAAGIDAATISLLSAVGTNGAFLAAAQAGVVGSSAAIGSPGTATVATGGGGGTTTTTTIAGPTGLPWPGSATVSDASTYAFGGNMSGLIEEPSGTSAPGVLWAVRNGPGGLFRLVWNGTAWAPDSGDWAAGKTLRYPDGTGDPDAEGVTFTDAGSAGGIFVATERNNAASNVSRPTILRFDPTASGTSLAATQSWDLTADLPALGANLGPEAITWIPDSYLVGKGFRDETRGKTYDPADHPGHGNGLFFVGVEANGTIYAYALNQTGGTYARVATIASGWPSIMELQFDRDLQDLWAVCDNTCNGQHKVLRVDPATGAFATAFTFERPTGLPNYNNEGFAIASVAQCVGDRRPAHWADDSEDLGVAIRKGDVPCTSLIGGPGAVIPEFPFAALPALTAVLVIGGILVGRRRGATDLLA